MCDRGKSRLLHGSFAAILFVAFLLAAERVAAQAQITDPAASAAQTVQGAAETTAGGADAVPEPASSPSPGGDPLGLLADEQAHVAEAALASTLRDLRAKLRAAVGRASSVPGEILTVLERDEIALGREWLLDAMLVGLLGIAVGWGVAAAFERLTLRRTVKPAVDEEARTARIIGDALLQIASTMILIVVGYVVIEVLDVGVDVQHLTSLILLLVVACTRGALLIVRTSLMPGDPPGTASAADVVRLRRWLTAFILIFAVTDGLDWWLIALDVSQEARDIGAGVLSLVIVLALSALVIANRNTVPAVFRHSGRRHRPEGGVLAQFWWVFAILFFMLSWAVRVVRLLLDLPGPEGLVRGPIGLLFIGLIAYGLVCHAINRLMRRSPAIFVGGPGGRRLRDYRDLSHDAAALLIVLAAFAVLAQWWGLALAHGQDGLIVAKIAAISVAAWIFCDLVRVAIDRKHAREGGIPNTVAEDVSFSPPPAGRSRLATLLPFVRLTVLVAIGVISVTMALSELGIDLLPLIASASIFGIALGFGSQALIRDVMAGAFFLIDDAFRVGEYVDLGGGTKGLVEKTSLRSFQLRHHRGALHTIPFGDIKQITNLSRDWAITKIALLCPHGTDIEAVRKVTERAGEALLGDREVGGYFIEPLKMSGVGEISVRGITVSIKFMSPPDVAHHVKKAVNARLAVEFAAAGISLAGPPLSLRFTDQPNPAVPDAYAGPDVDRTRVPSQADRAVSPPAERSPAALAIDQGSPPSVP